MIITEFLKSSAWKDVQTRVFTTLGFTSIGTAANSVPQSITAEQAEQLLRLDILTKYFALGSYILSGIVAATVILRFIMWMIDRYKNKKNN